MAQSGLKGPLPTITVLVNPLIQAIASRLVLLTQRLTLMRMALPLTDKAPAKRLQDLISPPAQRPFSIMTHKVGSSLPRFLMQTGNLLLIQRTTPLCKGTSPSIRL